MADDETYKDDDQEPIYSDPHTKYSKYPLKPTLWQRVKEKFDPDNYADLEAVRKRRLRSTGQSEE